MTGGVSPPLYYFWIIFGLTLATPVMLPWVRAASRVSVLFLGVAAALIPILTVATRDVRNVPLGWIETPWTWWIPYVGFFLLGWGLRGVRVSGPALAVLYALTIGMMLELIWQWRGVGVPTWLSQLSPVSYYGLTVHLYAIMVFVLVQSSLLGPARPWVRLLGDATLGVFAVHIAVLGLVVRSGVLGSGAVAPTGGALLLRVAAVSAGTYAVVLGLQRIAFMRRVV